MNIFYKLVIILSFLIFNDSKSNDFPTLARSEFVFACMSSNESNRDFMAKCSCAIDEIAKRIRMGPGREDEKDVSFLNRIVRWVDRDRHRGRSRSEAG